MADNHTDKFLPHAGPWALQTNITMEGALYATWHLTGFPSELANGSSILGRRSEFNQLALNTGIKNSEWWVHITRRQLPKMTPLPQCTGWFAQRFDDAYIDCMDDNLYVNDNWFTLLIPAPTGLSAGLRSVFTRMRNAIFRGDKPPVPCPETIFIQAFNDMANKIENGLRFYGPTRLGLRRDPKTGTWFNQIDAALHIILNNKPRLIPASLGRSGRNIDPHEVEYGDRDFCVHTGSETKTFGTCFSFMNYPAKESPIIFEPLLAAPFPFTLTNSGKFYSSWKMMQWLDTHIKTMVSGNDAAVEQHKQLVKTRGNLQAREIVMLNHGFTLTVFSNKGLTDLDSSATEAETLLGNAGINPVREDKALKPTRFAQLPGNAHWRPRPQKIPSDAFVSFAAINAVPKGRMRGRWGAPLLILRSSANTEYPLHFQVQGSAQIPKEDLGNMMLFGPSGSGKSALEGALLLAAAGRQNARGLLVDKDCGLGVLMLAAGGVYLVLENAQPSGISLLRGLTASVEDIDHIIRTIKLLIMQDKKGEISPSEEERLPHLVRRTMSMPPHMRELAGIAVGLGASDENGGRARLRIWCWGNDNGWVLDGRHDTLDMTNRLVGYDTTSILKNPDACGPILNEIFYRSNKMIDGKPFVLACDEIWHAEQNEAFAAANSDKLATIRKLEGVVLLSTQNPRSVLASKHAHNYIQQVPSKIFFADADASYKDMIEGMHATEGEFETVTAKLGLMKHAFLLKRPSGSLVCRFDMRKRPDIVSVISGRKATFELALELRRKYGEEPRLWVPHYEKQAPLVVDDPMQQEKVAA